MVSSSAFQNTVQPTTPYTNSNRAGGNSPENELKCCTYYGEVWRTCMFGNKILLTRRVVQANSTRSDHFLIADCQTDGSRFVARRERQHGQACQRWLNIPQNQITRHLFHSTAKWKRESSRYVLVDSFNNKTFSLSGLLDALLLLLLSLLFLVLPSLKLNFNPVISLCAA